jgi:dienelactone hydrolase
MIFGSILARFLRGAALPALLSLATPVAWAQVGDCETVAAGLAEPVTLPTPRPGGESVAVQALLRRPPGGSGAPGPAIIVLHGHPAIGPPRCYRPVTDLLTQSGYVTLTIDSASQTTAAGVGIAEYSTSEQATHARAGAAFLAALPEVDPGRIGILGYSTGGLSTIKAIAEPDPPIAAAVVYYPICPVGTWQLHVPLLILIGGNDRVVSVPGCRAFKAANQEESIELVIYPGAGHIFDASWAQAYDPDARFDARARQRRHFEKHLSQGNR